VTSYHWAKLWIDVLDDHKLGPLDDHLWRRFFEFVLLAKEADDNGWLPTTRAIAWRLRTTEAEIAADLEALAEVCDGTMLERKGDRWHIVNFVKRQETPMDAAERKARQRERERRLGDDDVTDTDTPTSRASHETVTTCDTEKRREEKKRGGEAEQSRSAAAPSSKPTPSDNGQSRAPSTDRSTSYTVIDPSVLEEGPSPALRHAWGLFQDEMRMKIGQASYDKFVNRLEVITRQEDVVVIRAPPDAVEWCRDRWRELIPRTLSDVLEDVVRVSYLEGPT